MQANPRFASPKGALSRRQTRPGFPQFQKRSEQKLCSGPGCCIVWTCFRQIKDLPVSFGRFMMMKYRLKNLPLMVLLVFWTASLVAAPPVIPGYHALAEDDAFVRGELLLGELGCVACHVAPPSISQRIATKRAPDLSRAGERLTPQYLQKFLTSPRQFKPGTTMPDIFHSSEPHSRDGAVDYLVHFLASQGGPIDTENQTGTSIMLERGERLFHTVGCVACHAPDNPEGINTPMVPLEKLAWKTTVDSLTEFLLDPLKVRVSGRMPSLSLDEREARSIAVYLLRDQFENPQSKEAGPGKSPGLVFEYYHVPGLSNLPDFDALEPVGTGTVPFFTLDLPLERRKENFALRYRGIITIPQTGEYRFATRSDDGSQLYINGKKIVENDGTHGMQTEAGAAHLTQGDHEIEVRFFQAGGDYGLEVYWAGPGISGKREQIPADALWNSSGEPMIPLESAPFTVDRAKAEMGATMFSVLRCVSCHQIEGLKQFQPIKPLVRLDLNNPEGCLGDRIRRGLPDYRLTAQQRADLKSTLDRLPEFRAPLDPAAQIKRTMARLNCYACHERDGVGGPDTARAVFFESTVPIDLGEEGKIPPGLTGVGAKLKPSALEQILLEGALRVRPYMATRMPLFGETNLAPLLAHLGEADGLDEVLDEPSFTEESWKIGHLLVGVEGMSCITCHNLAGHQAVGIPGIDLATTYERLNPGWFKQFLLDPGAFNYQTRMPQFWPEGESPFPELANGSTDRQIEGIWSYLALRNSMPLPAGIQPKGGIGMELIPLSEPIVHRTFMAEVGTRAIVAGYPEKVHLAFDANAVRLAMAWRGRFFDAAGVASGRTDAFLGPLGEEVIHLPPGPAFAILDSTQTPWPRTDKLRRNVGGRFRGYYLDEDRRPIFRYLLENIQIEEQPIPVVQPGGAILVRRFQLKSPEQTERLHFMLAAGDLIQQLDANSWIVNGRLQISLDSNPGLDPVLRQSEGRQELLLPIPFNDGVAQFETTIKW
jgi:mono/diheme cytochrome c family protein